jgi:hypothetical protein
VWRNFDQVEARGDGSFYGLLQWYNTAILAICVDEPNWRDTDLPIDTV